MTIQTKENLVIPASVRRRAGVKAGDRLEFSVSPRTIVITALPEKTYKPTKAELGAIEKGEREIARGNLVTLPELLDDLDRRRRGARAKTTRKVSR